MFQFRDNHNAGGLRIMTSTMIRGIILGGLALLAFVAAVFLL
jgi:hypothetical protein